MYKVLAACGAGIGSSMIIKKKIKNVFDKLGLEVEITHESLGTAQSSMDKYDIVFTLAALAENFPKDSKNVVGLKNIMSEGEIEEAVHRILEV
ncbi:PTS sugar transporter subunit IIB [Clostridiales bacterium COT073_COT-073]|nr:PTS sugar transporter subunit IIB [Clostridiales bacterium COT073_COT-073]